MRAPKKTIDHAQQLRRTLSTPEVLLWSRLRKRAPDKPVFRRQHPIGPYVLDFYCAKARLAIDWMALATTWAIVRNAIYDGRRGLRLAE